LQLNWKDINFNAFGQSREEQQAKTFTRFRQTIDKHTVQFDTFRIQMQQKLSDIDSTLAKLQPTAQKSPETTAVPPPQTVIEKKRSPSSSKQPSINLSTEQAELLQPTSIPTITEPTANILDEITRLRELLEETLVGQNDRVTTVYRPQPDSVSSTTTSRRSTASLASHHHQQTPTNVPPTIPETPHETQTDPITQNLSERVTDLQLAVNRLHQDVTAIRQIFERMSPLSTSLILGRSTGRR
jgi:uncharacterized coiled-coil protein SlyX